MSNQTLLFGQIPLYCRIIKSVLDGGMDSSRLDCESSFKESSSSRKKAVIILQTNVALGAELVNKVTIEI